MYFYVCICRFQDFVINYFTSYSYALFWWSLGKFVELLLCFVPAKIINYILKPQKSYWRCSKEGEVSKASGNKSSYVKWHIFWILEESVLFCFPLPSFIFLWVIRVSELEFSGQFLFGTYCLTILLVIYCLFVKCIAKELCQGCLAWDCNSEIVYIYQEEKHSLDMCYFFRYADSVILLLPQLEVGLRLLFTTSNKCPNRLLTAEVNFCLKSVMI